MFRSDTALNVAREPPTDGSIQGCSYTGLLIYHCILLPFNFTYCFEILSFACHISFSVF